MGKNKLDLPLGSNHLGGMAFQEVLHSDLDLTIVITRKGDSFQWLFPFSRNTGWGYVRCKEENKGQSTSIKVGIRAAMSQGADAVIILLADQPFVKREGINKLLSEYSRNPKLNYIGSSQNGVLMPPILFSKSLFDKLMDLEGDKGARSFIRGKIEDQGKKIEFEDGYFFDVDTLEDYNELLRRLEG